MVGRDGSPCYLGASAAPPSLDRLIGEELVARLEKKEVPNGEEERAGRKGGEEKFGRTEGRKKYSSAAATTCRRQPQTGWTPRWHF